METPTHTAPPVASTDLFALSLAKEDETSEPKPDLAKCSQCGWKGPVEDCGTDSEGDWESGYYDIHTCPKCDDGGCVDDYDMTPDQEARWWAWHSLANAKDL